MKTIHERFFEAAGKIVEVIESSENSYQINEEVIFKIAKIALEVGQYELAEIYLKKVEKILEILSYEGVNDIKILEIAEVFSTRKKY